MITITLKIEDDFSESSTEVIKKFESDGGFEEVFNAVKDALYAMGFHPETVSAYFPDGDTILSGREEEIQ